MHPRTGVDGVLGGREGYNCEVHALLFPTNPQYVHMCEYSAARGSQHISP